MRMIDKVRIFFDLDYVSGKEYWIPFGEIKIKDEFYATPPKNWKYEMKLRKFIKTGELSPIMIDRNYELVDGYCSYLIYKRFGVEKIPVMFE